MRKIRKICLAAFASLFVLSIGFALPNLNANAAEGATPLTVGVSTNLTMKQGASVRLDTDENGRTGLKFSAEVPTAQAEATNSNVTYGALIVPYDYFARAGVMLADGIDYVTEFTTAKTEGKIPNAAMIANGLTPVKEKDGKYYVSYSITNLKSSNYDRKFFGVVYEKTETTISYAPFNDNSRAIMEVASAALNDYHSEDFVTTNPDTYATYQRYASTLNGFMDTGVSNMTNKQPDTYAYAISGDSTVGTGDTLALSVYNMLPTWTSSDETVATIDKNGVVTALKMGTTTITATNKWNGTTYTNSKEVKVTGKATLDFPSSGMENSEALGTRQIDDKITITGAKGTNSNNVPKYYESGASLRVYVGNILTFSVAEGYAIESIVMTSHESNKFSAQSYTVSNVDDSLNTEGTVITLIPIYGAEQVAFIHSDSKGQHRIVSIVVTYRETTEADYKPAADLSTPEGIVDAAYALGIGESLETPVTLTGKITEMASNGPVITVGDMTDKTILCYNLTGEGADSLKLGYTITVEGTLENDNATIEFDSAALIAVDKSTVVATDKFETVKTELNVPSNIAYENADTAVISLPTVGVEYSDVTIEWTENSENASVDGGNITFNFTSEIQSIELTATLSCGGEHDEQAFTVTIAAKPQELPDDVLTAVLDFQVDNGFVSGESMPSQELDKAVTIEAAAASKYYTGELRVYQNNQFIITPMSGYKLVRIIITSTNNADNNVDLNSCELVSQNGELSVLSEDSVQIEVTDGLSAVTIQNKQSKQLKIYKIEVNYSPIIITEQDRITAAMDAFTFVNSGKVGTAIELSSTVDGHDGVSITWSIKDGPSLADFYTPMAEGNVILVAQFNCGGTTDVSTNSKEYTLAIAAEGSVVEPITVTLDIGALIAAGTGEKEKAVNFEKDGVTISSDNGTSNTLFRWWTDHIRAYKGNTVTFEVNGMIQSITITASTSNPFNGTPSSGTLVVDGKTTTISDVNASKTTINVEQNTAYIYTIVIEYIPAN